MAADSAVFLGTGIFETGVEIDGKQENRKALYCFSLLSDAG